MRTKPAGVLAPLPKPAPQRPSLLPYLAIVGSYLLLAVIGLRGVRFDFLGGLLAGAVALTFLISARQYISLHDYGRLAVRYQELASVDGTTGLYNRRHFMEAAEAAIARWKQVIGDGLRSRRDERQATEVDVGVYALNRMLELGRPISVRIA